MPGARLKETPRHKKAYEAWYASEGRRFAKVARQLQVSSTALRGWAKNFGWEERAAARDAKAAAKTEEKIVDKIVEMNARHLEYADAMQKLGMRSLAKENSFKPADAVKAVETGVKMERLVRDQPTESQSVQIKIEIEEIKKKEA